MSVDNDFAITTVRSLYHFDGRKALRNRTVFGVRAEGSTDAMCIKCKDKAEIQRLVEKWNLVWTRSDVPLSLYMKGI